MFFFPIKMQHILSFSSLFIMFHVYRKKTKSQQVIPGITAILNWIIRSLECPYHLSYSFLIASSSFFCYFIYSPNFLFTFLALFLHRFLHYCPVQYPCLKLTALVRLLQDWTCLPTISVTLSSPSISLKSLLKVFPPCKAFQI